MTVLLALGILAAIAVMVIAMYNALVRLRVQADSAWADVDVQLERRYDLIPNLVETVKGYAGHEKKTLEGVVNARNRAMSAQGPAEKSEVSSTMGAAMTSSPRQTSGSSGFSGRGGFSGGGFGGGGGRGF